MFDRLDYLPDDDKYKPALVLIVSLLSTIILIQWVNLIHHWVVIALKWWIYRIVTRYLQAAQDAQEQQLANITEMKDLLTLVKTWWELSRIQTTRQTNLNTDMKDSLNAAVQKTSDKIDTIPDKVVDKIQSSGSGIIKSPKEDLQ